MLGTFAKVLGLFVMGFAIDGTEQPPDIFTSKAVGIELEIRLDKSSFKQNEAIRLDVCIINNTDDMYVSVDDRFRRTWNFYVTVYDEDNEVVEYPGWRSASRIVQPSTLDAFVLIKPRKYYGDSSAFVLHLKEPGKYRVEVGYRGGATEETIQKLGVPYYYTEFIQAKPLSLIVTE